MTQRMNIKGRIIWAAFGVLSLANLGCGRNMDKQDCVSLQIGDPCVPLIKREEPKSPVQVPTMPDFKVSDFPKVDLEPRAQPFEFVTGPGLKLRTSEFKKFSEVLKPKGKLVFSRSLYSINYVGCVDSEQFVLIDFSKRYLNQTSVNTGEIQKKDLRLVSDQVRVLEYNELNDRVIGLKNIESSEIKFEAKIYIYAEDLTAALWMKSSPKSIQMKCELFSELEL